MTPLPQDSGQRAARAQTLGIVLIGVGLLAWMAEGAIQVRIWQRQRLPKIQAGDLAPVSVKTPVSLTVEDVSSTLRLREQEGQRIPPVFEFDAEASERTANRFLEKYDSTQIQFLRGLKKTWEVPLDEKSIQSDTFHNFVAAFGMAHASFPMSDELAGRWAGGLPEDVLRRETVDQLREHQRQYIVSDQIPSGSTANHSEYWLFTRRADAETPSLAELGRDAHVLTVKSVRSIKEVERALAESLRGCPDQWTRFAAEFLEPNLFFDAPLTAAARREASKALVVHKELAAGETVIEMGRPVSQTQAAALAQLKQHYATVNARRRPANQWLLGLGLGGVLGGAWLRRESRRPTPVAAGTVRPAANSELDRLRTGLLNQMSRWLKERFVSRLIDQRNDALANQSLASDKVDQINTRLNCLQPEIQQRIAGYEKRIEDLERELVESNAMNKELIQTRIQMARKELEIEKAKSNLTWN